MRHEPCLDKQSFPKSNLLVFELQTRFSTSRAKPDPETVCRLNTDGVRGQALTRISVRRQLSFGVKPSTIPLEPKAAGTVWRIAVSDSNTRGR
jgi:hypothetical protein